MHNTKSLIMGWYAVDCALFKWIYCNEFLITPWLWIDFSFLFLSFNNKPNFLLGTTGNMLDKPLYVCISADTFLRKSKKHNPFKAVTANVRLYLLGIWKSKQLFYSKKKIILSCSTKHIIMQMCVQRAYVESINRIFHAIFLAFIMHALTLFYIMM